MKKILSLLGLTTILSASSLTSQAQTPQISSYCYEDRCYAFFSDVITTCNSTNFSTCMIETSHGDGTVDTQNVGYVLYIPNCSVPPGYITGYGELGYHNYAVTGTYTIKKVLIYGSTRVDSVSASAYAACASVGGYIYWDANSDCIYNAGSEPHIPSTVKIQIDSNGVHVDTVAAYGLWNYSLKATTMTNYAFKLLGAPASYVTSCPSTGQFNYVHNPGVSTPPSMNFGFNCSTPAVFDLQLSWNRAFRGSTSGGSSYISLTATNITCLTTTGTVTLQVSPKYNITTSGILPTPTSVSGHTITWTLSSMMNGSYYWMHVPLTPLSTTNSGDTVCTYAIITPTIGDVNVANNSISKCDSVRSSWDPNHKTVSPDSDIAAGALLTYTVQFENLGNDTAFNVHIQDTLSANVDPSSIAVISSTHPMRTNLYEAPSGRTVIKFDFPNIKLADKTHPLTNKGSVTFSVKTKTGLSVGTQIANRAGIYFDGNEVVLTNTAYNNIPLPTSIQLVNHSSGITVYPNPAHETFIIRVQQGRWIEASLMNTIGQVITRVPLTGNENVLNVQRLPAGIYYLQARGASGTYTERIEKQ
jgi:uncharacterized repeat protein (TIGR01451 family)